MKKKSIYKTEEMIEILDNLMKPESIMIEEIEKLVSVVKFILIHMQINE
jgi:hypothetical protein